MVDHIADKVVATFQLYGDQQRPSTRYKDLVDLVSIVTGASVAAGPQLAALASEAQRRGVTLPARFGIRDPALWEPGYAAEAARSLLPIARTLAEVLAAGPHAQPGGSSASAVDGSHTRCGSRCDVSPDAHPLR